MKKKQLNYSALTDTVYWVDGKGAKQDVTQNFIQMMLLWLNQSDISKVVSENKRELRVGGKVHFEITCKNINQ